MTKWRLRKCIKCGRYTLNVKECPECGEVVSMPHPGKFSLDDKYLRYKMAMRIGRTNEDFYQTKEKNDIE